MAVTKLRRFATGLRKACNPVALGQTRGGLVLAAVLIACWQLSVRTLAQDAVGYSENDYFRLEWEYALDEGTGTIRLSGVGDWLWRTGVVEHGRFTTAGVTFDSNLWHGHDEEVFGPPTYQGNEEGRPVYEYDLLNPLFLCYGDVVQIDVTYPSEGVELRAAEFDYEGYTLSAPGPVIPIPPGEVPFATVQTIPEPSACATLGLGAAAIAAVLRRRNR
jgi:hypothetical protein